MADTSQSARETRVTWRTEEHEGTKGTKKNTKTKTNGLLLDPQGGAAAPCSDTTTAAVTLAGLSWITTEAQSQRSYWISVLSVSVSD
jgi:hypothetical protein